MIGRMLVRYFKANGVHVINVVRRQEQVDILKNEGAEYVLNSSDPEFTKNLEALSAELKATIAFDAIGGEQTATILSALPNGSKVLIYGALSNTGY
jgi:NADPH:quinone reductase-like Zn-dependent oxidoreductase